MAVSNLLLLALLCSMFAYCRGACAEPDSDTEAVAGKGFKLGCLSCKRRSEVTGTATVQWYFRGKGEADFYHIYTYNAEGPTIESDNFMDRVDWNGSKRSPDIQDASIYLLNVTFNDSGTYQCFFNRILFYDNYEYSTTVSKVVHLTVVAKATRGTASIVSEVMMYVTIIGLQVWLLIEMIYCYKKISAAGEEALREAAKNQNLPPVSQKKEQKSVIAVIFFCFLHFSPNSLC
ncbi:sodium channel, voltage-gated, type I, beta b isoform X1 [Anarhichas minor]|uniref:sodium channel, voltage-gated, type I, beta b isoform X1 n=1 Tax=Anarhichas minor TaxID=65739 RepID=UPI003F73C8D1